MTKTGTVLPKLPPSDVIGSVEIFGQHKFSELTRKPDKLAEILRRFTDPETVTSSKGLVAEAISIAEMTAATGWQSHSVRGALPGTEAEETRGTDREGRRHAIADRRPAMTTVDATI